MTTVRLERVELKHGCEVLMNGRASREWVASKHGVHLALDTERRLLRFYGSDGVPMWVPVENAKAWVTVDDADEARKYGVKAEPVDELAAQRAEISARVEAAGFVPATTADWKPQKDATGFFGDAPPVPEPPPAPKRKRGKA